MHSNFYSKMYINTMKMKPIGRPREFDRDEAVHRAMELFWKQGYEGTTLADLQKAMGGITPPSFYAAFGSKEALFREAVELYKQIEGAPIAKALAGGPTARASIEAFLRAAAEKFCQPGRPRGCMMLLSGVNCLPANKGVEDFMREQRSVRAKMIRKRLRQGVTDGDLSKKADLNALASFYTGVADVLALRARDGASRKALASIIHYAMAPWKNGA
jgi:AcrR family transcriptional regulator